VARMVERDAYWVLVKKPEGLGPHGQNTHGKVILKWIFKKKDCGGGVDWFDRVQDGDKFCHTYNKLHCILQ
jgi:hypothetical protein